MTKSAQDVFGLIDFYIRLLDQLLEGRVTGDQFQTLYFKIYLGDTREMGDREFRVLDWLFAEVDAYVPDPELRDADDLDDDQLVDRVKQAKARLLDLR